MDRVSRLPAGAAQGGELLPCTRGKRGKDGTTLEIGQAPYKYARFIPSGCRTWTCLQFCLQLREQVDVQQEGNHREPQPPMIALEPSDKKWQPLRGLWHRVDVWRHHWRPTSETHPTFGQEAMSISSYLKRSGEHVSEQSEMENKTLDCTLRKFIS